MIIRVVVKVGRFVINQCRDRIAYHPPQMLIGVEDMAVALAGDHHRHRAGFDNGAEAFFGFHHLLLGLFARRNIAYKGAKGDAGRQVNRGNCQLDRKLMPLLVERNNLNALVQHRSFARRQKMAHPLFMR